MKFPRLLEPIHMQRLIKRSLPTSLFGRSLLIIVLPVALMQIAVTWIFFDAHWQTVTGRLSDGLAGEVAWAVESYEDEPNSSTMAKLADRAEKSLSLSIALQPGKELPARRRTNTFAVVDRSLERALSDRLDAPFWFDTTRYPAYVDIRVKVDQGVIRILAPRDRAFATQGHIFVLWMAMATILLTAIAILFIRNQTRTIERLASAADAFGRGIDAPAFKPSGAREVRQAAHAFLAMKSRIQRHIDQRTALLASVSHDLRTPLTRLKLELAMAEPSPRNAEMKRDLAEMEHMRRVSRLRAWRGRRGGRDRQPEVPDRRSQPGRSAGRRQGQCDRGPGADRQRPAQRLETSAVEPGDERSRPRREH